MGKKRNTSTIKMLLPGKTGEWLSKVEFEKPLRYHYTSPEAFLSIIRNKKLRFSDVGYMNDKTESIYFLKVLLDFMDLEDHRTRYPRVQEAINLLLEENDFRRIQTQDISEIIFKKIPRLRLPNQRRFLFCATAENDALNMWNYYIHNGQYQGYNIGLKVKEFLEGFTAPIGNEGMVIDGFEVYYGEVIYDDQKQYAELEYALDKMENHHVATGINFLAVELWLYIMGPGLFYKHPKFKGEKEFRIVISIAEQRIPHTEEETQKWTAANNGICEEFYVKNGLIVPCLSVPIPRNAISRITVAPIMEFEIAKRSIQEILKLSEFEKVSIYKSTIPVRF